MTKSIIIPPFFPTPNIERVALVAIVAIAYAIYELGKAFGWWDDVSGMWNAFLNNILIPVWNFLVNTFTPAWNAIGNAINAVMPFITTLAGAFTAFGNGQLDLVGLIWTVMTSMYNIYSTIFNMVISALVSFAASMIQQGVSGATNFVNGIVNRVLQLPSRVYSTLMGVVSRIRSAIQAWISAAKSKVSTLVSNVVSTLSSLPGKISSALSGVVNAIVKPFQDAYNKAKSYVDKIKNFDLGGLVGMGGDELEGGNGFNAGVDLSQTGSAMGGELTLVHDFKNLPNGVSAGEVADIVLATAGSKEFGQAIASNTGFQNTDLKIKNTIAGRANRSLGV